MIDLLKIAKSILSDVILKDEKEFKKYLENHPDYREDTVFIVNGVKRIAPSKKKKSKRLTQKELKNVDEIFNGVFEALETKGTDLEKLTPEKMQILHGAVNRILEKSGISKLTEKQFVDMFNKKKLEKYGKKEKTKKETSREKELEKIYRNPRTNTYAIGNMSRKDYFDYVNSSLKDSGNNELNEEEFKDYLRNYVFKFTPASNIKEAQDYTRKNFCVRNSNPKWNSIKLEHVNAINEELNNLRIDFPVMEEDLLDSIGTNNRFKENKIAVYRESFGFSINEYIFFNTKNECFQDSYISYPNSNLKQARSKYCYNTSDKGDNGIDAIKRTTAHEFGHKLWYQRKREGSGLTRKSAIFDIPYGYDEIQNTEFEKEWFQLYKSFKYGKFERLETAYRDISVYSMKNVKEFFAECFTMYRFDKEKLPNEIIEKMEEFIKWSTQMR